MNLINGNSLDILKSYPDNHFASCVTDPPYGLGFMGVAWDTFQGKGGSLTKNRAQDFDVLRSHEHPRKAEEQAGIRHKNNVALYEFTLAWAKEVYRVLKPGAHLLAFGGSRTYHRLACAIEDAGFEIRDQLQWIFGSGFPKGLDIAWEMHKLACTWHGIMVEYDHEKAKSNPGRMEGTPDSAKGKVQEAEHDLRFVRATYLSQAVYACAQCGQVLQPVMPEQDPQKHRRTWTESETVWPEQPGMEGRSNLEAAQGELQRCEVCQMSHGFFADGAQGWLCHGTSVGNGSIPWQVPLEDGSCPSYRPQSGAQLAREPAAVFVERRAQEERGWNVALKPAHEPIVVARKPLEGTVVQNVLKWGTGGINVGGCRIEGEEPHHNYGRTSGEASFVGQGPVSITPPAGRWPANVIHDGSEEVLSEFDKYGDRTSGAMKKPYTYKNNGFSMGAPSGETRANHDSNSGSAARFFYCAKASKAERNLGCENAPLGEPPASGRSKPAKGRQSALGKPRRNFHPTVKPLALMRYLVRLVTPPGGLVLDCFCGSGSTLIAAAQEGFDSVGIDRGAEYLDIAQARIKGHLGLFATSDAINKQSN